MFWQQGLGARAWVGLPLFAYGEDWICGRHCRSSTGICIASRVVFTYFLPHQSSTVLQNGQRPLGRASSAGIRQIPWWIYADDSIPLIDYDLITANHALAEFHPASLNYLLRRFGKEHTERFDRSPVIVAESLGARMRPWEDVVQQFHEHGWTHEFDGSFYIFRFQPERATEQLDADLRERRYQSSFLRTIKRTSYLFIRERTRKAKPKAAPRAQDVSLQELRSIFDDLVPGEKTPDEHYWSS